MRLKFFKVFILLSLSLQFNKAAAQLTTNLGSYHNQVFIGTGYTQSFNNITYGINHTRYFKRLKRDIAGILDFSSPLSGKYYTRFVVRKGFQVDLYKKGSFRVPFAMITSSVRKNLSIFSFHELITDFYLIPGWYTKKYTIAADLSLKVLWFHSSHIKPSYKHGSVTESPVIHRTINLSAGFVCGYTVARYTFLFKGGYAHVSDYEFNKAPFYVIGGLGYNFNFIKAK